MAGAFGFWGKAVGGLIDGGFDGAAKAMKTAWNAGKDLDEVYKGFMKASKQIKSDNAVDVFKHIKKNDADLAKKISSNFDKIGGLTAKSSSVSDVGRALRGGRRNAGYMSAFDKTGAVGVGYLGYRELRNPESNMPLVPFL